MNIILLLIGLLNLGLLIYFLQRSDDTRPALREMLEDHEDHLTDQLDYRFEKERQASQIANQQLEIALTDRLTEMRVEIHQQTTALRAEMNEHFTKNRDKTDERMRQIQESNEVRLEQMRQTVEEKLEKTLQHRLQTSFETVSKQLESVNKGWEKCRQWRGMSEPLIKFSPIPRRVGLWANYSWVKLLKIS